MKKIFLTLILSILISGCSHTSIVNTEPALNNTSSAPAIQTDNVLNLSQKNLTKIDMSVFDKTDLVELDISNNQLIGALPSQIGKLKNLKVLKAGNNQMTGVPAEIGQLNNLEILDLSNNQLTGLPNELANLKNLKTLNLSGNQYSEQDLNIIRNSLPNVNYILK
ncbi:MAG: Leucine-rich repeat-containing protein 40 [Candidatus Falkowbacteria bacterium GW2011_GWC2_38_22]|uniref:Leucine-rich repeat-containing protein 40 n=1 Tax=Candidatus Falkowbacteria bacterium GW2011_GWE1_38_31 TaxID=1618638 RepID=A0A0G0JUF7_9BACT|nr:MAG: Leucine-rich repeat-containing protein 40 [Candidatus Falkowbacteria bacterium GW2011_GWF2_38_1205]KKQ61379.1 MAG: Leucine-rich repeat-containing protein 40 [Candidatus Falkowbacteria bacterium GW2011_GWC2_38_22]KKQ64038.1 MAG: Leucine-rich repeat-containing protein 40 [Candidatus Falkowbacteria bacterium GW2011_GWF1_38_22]KKQ66614.1 MAG: Leucine-rich repeat-containing protein 40 [Candidatus Falkowbacteria bacterium GW2011_GWE2_38_254]KKQ71143.1 MAG: Leucine-rich repeat-containing prote